MYFDGSLLSIIFPCVLWFALMNSHCVERQFPLALFLCAPISYIDAVPLCLLRVASPSCEKDLVVGWYFCWPSSHSSFVHKEEHFLLILN